MNRINQLFATKKRGILSIYFCAGYPTLDGTREIIKNLEQNGIDMIEIGIPFSDPMADGPVIQHAATQALHNGMTLKVLFSQLSGIRNDVKIPLVLMGYLNPIMQYGFENFCHSCRECGIDGIIIPDLPFKEYIKNYKEIAERHDLKMIMLITPETSEERIRLIDDHTDGFIVSGHHRRTKKLRRAEASLLPPHRIHAIEETANDRIRDFQPTNFRNGLCPCLRSNHRQ